MHESGPTLNTKDRELNKNNSHKLREVTPGSIVVQTIRLGRVMMDTLEDLRNNRLNRVSPLRQPTQKDLFCPQETLVKIMLYFGSIRCAEWRKQLDGLSDHYVLNQLAIQIGWLIGYFSHLDKKPPEKAQYLEYGLPMICLYREHIYKLMESYASAVHAQESAQQSQENSEAEALLNEIHCLSEKASTQIPPAFTDFQKQIVIAQASIEKELVDLIMQKYPIKIIIMSLFYFWFTLEAPLHATNPKSIDGHDAFSHMGAIIGLVKSTARSLPDPRLAPEIKAINEKMQLLKSYLPHPEDLDEVEPENREQKTAHINTVIHTVTSELLKKDIHLEAVAIALFNHWLRLSVFFGISESDWQKMDYYLPDVLKSVRNYLSTI